MRPAFEVKTRYERYNEETNEVVCVERTKGFDVQSYQQAWDYYVKKRDHYDKLRGIDEGAYYDHVVGGRTYRSEYTEFDMPNDGWLVLKINVNLKDDINN